MARTQRRKHDDQLDAFVVADQPEWPPHRYYPYNANGSKVETVLNADLEASADPLLITGYTSLPRLITFLGRSQRRLSKTPDAISRARILIGHEPVRRSTRSFRIAYDLGQEIADHWLTHGVSILLSGEVVRALHMLEDDRVQIRCSQKVPVHAKIYVTESAVTGGSSNYSDAGLTWQIEANWRFEASEEQRYAQSVRLAEAIWTLGMDYKQSLAELLDQLLRAVTWEEALMRACAALLEGEWAKKYVAVQPYGESVRLWPSQEAGLAQAMWVMANVGGVLVADAAGSGKTKLGAYLIRAVQQRDWRLGRMRQDVPLIVSPPPVRETWIAECLKIGSRPAVHSHGVLSGPESKKRREALQAVRQAQAVGIDEAHNFHNRRSRRTRELYASMADHVVLFTATPINRGPHDLLPLIDLLGADSFEDRTLSVLQGIWSRGRRRGRLRLTNDESKEIASAIRRFTVRRTKSDFNGLIDQDPEAYRDAAGRLCRYPDQDARTFACGASPDDRRLAEEIRTLARELTGVALFKKPLRLPVRHPDEGPEEETAYLDRRLKPAKALAAHNVAATLRSSKAALLEHLHGTDEACGMLGLDNSLAKTPSGNVIGSLRDMAGSPPGNRLSVEVPDWVTDGDVHRLACDADREIYEKIGEIAKGLSDGRETAKAELLVDLRRRHDRVLAFDSRPITLMDLRHRLQSLGEEIVLIAIGGRDRDRNRFIEAFSPIGEGTGLGLCSDAMAEAVNLQGASAAVLLDMPSVIRIAEQRIGRIDRMDSPHPQIEVYWPDDSPEFALRTEELLIERNNHVTRLLGSNLRLPELFRRAGEGIVEPVTANDYRNILGELSDLRLLDGIADAFQPVRALVDGATALVNPEDYRHLRKSRAQVISCVSIVKAAEEWALYAIGGSDREAPRWVLVDPTNKRVEVDLELISSRLSALLIPGAPSFAITDTVGERIKGDLALVAVHERELLPKRKQRALAEMDLTMRGYERLADGAGDQERLEVVRAIRTLNHGGEREMRVDLNRLAEWWLNIIRPYWDELVTGKRRTRPALLRDLRPKLRERPVSTEDLRSCEEIPLEGAPLDERVVAAIVGVADTTGLGPLALRSARATGSLPGLRNTARTGEIAEGVDSAESSTLKIVDESGRERTSTQPSADSH